VLIALGLALRAIRRIMSGGAMGAWNATRR
jgi:hypothetical protein